MHLQVTWIETHHQNHETHPEFTRISRRFRKQTLQVLAKEQVRRPLITKIESILEKTGTHLLCDLVASLIGATAAQKLEVLVTVDLKERLLYVSSLLAAVLNEDTQTTAPDPATALALPEQTGVDALVQRYEAIRDHMNEEARNSTGRALQQLQDMHASQNKSGEYHKLVTYVGWMLNLPWADESATRPPAMTLQEARSVLDNEHHGTIQLLNGR